MNGTNLTSMAFRVIPRTVYDFTALGSGGIQTIFIAQHIDVSPFQEVDFVVRGHPGGVMSGGQQVLIEAVADGWTPEDPTRFFETAVDSSGYPMAAVTWTSATAWPTYSVLSVGATSGTERGFGKMLAVQISATQTTAMTDFSVVVSIDLVCKGGDPSGIVPAYNTYRGYQGDEPQSLVPAYNTFYDDP